MLAGGRIWHLLAACLCAAALAGGGHAAADESSVSAADAPRPGSGAAAWTTPPPPRVRRLPFTTPPSNVGGPARVTRRVPVEPRAVTPPQRTTSPTPSHGSNGAVVTTTPPAIQVPRRMPPSPGATARPPGARPAQRVVSAQGVGGPAFRFAVGDTVRVSIFDEDVDRGTIELEQRILRDGTISPRWLDPVHVAGRTITEVRAELVEAYSKYYKIPRITVSVVSVHLERAFVLGEVREAKAVELNGPTTLLQAISMAGGVTTETADRGRIRVIRNRGEGVRPFVYTLNTNVLGRANSFQLKQGDVVFVHPSGLANWDRKLTQALGPIAQILNIVGGISTTALAIDSINQSGN